MSNLFSRFRRSLLHNTIEPDTTNEKQASIPTPNYRIRVEMLQLAVLIAMPSPRRSRRKNSVSKLENLDPDDDEKESDDELPDMVFGVARVNYRQPPSTLLPLQPKQAWCGSVLNSSFLVLLSSSLCYYRIRSPYGQQRPVSQPILIIDFGRPKHEYPHQLTLFVLRDTIIIISSVASLSNIVFSHPQCVLFV